MKTKTTAALILICLLAGACKTGRPAATGRDAVSDRLTAEIDSLTAKNNYFEGLAVAVVSNKGIAYEHTFGYADRRAGKKYARTTIQNIGSISKTFIGVSLLKAQELGKLSLDDPINKYLPFEVNNPSFPEIPITIRQLAGHVSSITDNPNYYTQDYFLKKGQDLTGVSYPTNGILFNPPEAALPLEAFLQNLLAKNGKWRTRESFSSNRPGTRYEYSNNVLNNYLKVYALATILVKLPARTCQLNITNCYITDTSLYRSIRFIHRKPPSTI